MLPYSGVVSEGHFHWSCLAVRQDGGDLQMMTGHAKVPKRPRAVPFSGFHAPPMHRGSLERWDCCGTTAGGKFAGWGWKFPTSKKSQPYGIER
jgi:hypothetical protein